MDNVMSNDLGDHSTHSAGRTYDNKLCFQSRHALLYGNLDLSRTMVTKINSLDSEGF